MNLLHVCERIEHDVRDKQERREQGREDEGCGADQRVSGPLADAPVKFYRLKKHVPTVEAQKAAQINAEAAQACGGRNEEPARYISKNAPHDRLHQVERE